MDGHNTPGHMNITNVQGIVDRFNGMHGTEIACRLASNNDSRPTIEFVFSICEDSCDDYFEDFALMLEEALGKGVNIEGIEKSGEAYLVEFVIKTYTEASK